MKENKSCSKNLTPSSDLKVAFISLLFLMSHISNEVKKIGLLHTTGEKKLEIDGF